MSLNPNTRTECLETLLNPAEMNGFTALSKLLGLSKSALNRSLINSAVRTHGTAPARGRESRGCPGPGRPSGRERGISNGRRHL
jgi:hypothetical protein